MLTFRRFTNLFRSAPSTRNPSAQQQQQRRRRSSTTQQNEGAGSEQMNLSEDRENSFVEMTCKGISLKYILREFKDDILKLEPKLQDKPYNENVRTTAYISIKDAVIQVIKPYCGVSQQSVLQIWEQEQEQEQKQDNIIRVNDLANVFISHSWSYDITYVIALLEKLLEEEMTKGNDDIFIWMDIFCINQYALHSMSQEFFSNGFHKNIGKIGRTFAIFMPWQSPYNLRRGWCLWELFGTIERGSQLEIRMGVNEEEDFIRTLRQDFDSVMEHLCEIDVSKAKTHNEDDMMMINHAISESKGGAARVNEVIMNFMRDWIASTGKESIEKMREDPEIDCENSANFAQLCACVGLLLKNQGHFHESETLLRECLKVSRNVHGSMHEETATASDNLANLLESLGKTDEAESLYRKGLEIRKQILGESHSSVATSLSNLAGLLQSQGRADEAEDMFRQALAIDEKVENERSVEDADGLNNVALFLQERGEYAEAENLYEKSLDIKRKVLGENHPSIAASLNNLAGSLNSLGKTHKAEECYRKALDIHRKVYGNTHHLVATSMGNLGNILRDQGKYSEAESHFRQALEIGKQIYGGEDHLFVATSLNNLAGVLQDQGRIDEAEVLYRQCLEIKQRIIGENHPSVATAMNNLARILILKGKDYFQEAKELHQQGMQSRKDNLGTKHPSYASSLDVGANLYRQLGMEYLDQALEMALEAWNLRKELTHDECHSDVLTSELYLALVYIDKGESFFHQAESHLNHVIQGRSSKLGELHPKTLESQYHLARLYCLQGKSDEGTRLLLYVEENQKMILGADHLQSCWHNA